MGKPDTIKAVFGQRVRSLRREKKWSQEEFALICGLDRTYISSIEQGKRNVALTNLEKIAKGLGVSLSELLDV